jgi:ribosomal protein L37AE/L43A
MADLADVWVCTDCYFAHHYGATEVDGQWYAGESDTPSDREPLGLIPDIGHVSGIWRVTFVSDNTCSEHSVSEILDGDEYEIDTTECPHCGQRGWEDGHTEFTWSSCDGCGSHLGGSRYRLAIHWEEIEHAH